MVIESLVDCREAEVSKFKGVWLQRKETLPHTSVLSHRLTASELNWKWFISKIPLKTKSLKHILLKTAWHRTRMSLLNGAEDHRQYFLEQV